MTERNTRAPLATQAARYDREALDSDPGAFRPACVSSNASWLPVPMLRAPQASSRGREDRSQHGAAVAGRFPLGPVPLARYLRHE